MLPRFELLRQVFAWLQQDKRKTRGKSGLIFIEHQFVRYRFLPELRLAETFAASLPKGQEWQ